MEDSTATTIEFLRARLISERSVSRTARQRADELAKRVAELEEQLKIVSLQRKKAEKATVDVLAILENQDMSDISEAFDSSCDQETPCESKVDNNSTKEEESSVNSKVRRNVSEEPSGSDLNNSPVSGRSLSWKGHKDALHSQENYKDCSIKRRNSFASIGSSSPKHRIGKSCRKIRHRETRSVAEEFKTESVKVDSQENGVATSSEGFPKCLDGGPGTFSGVSENQEQKVVQESPVSGCLENQSSVNNNDPYLNGYGRAKDMEKALEHQAQLIGQYEAMEKAQREWEEKFRENNSSTPDSCDPGNHSDITEERDEIKAQIPCPAETVTLPALEAKSEMENVCFSKESSRTQPNGFQQHSHVDMGHTQNQKCSSTLAYDSPTQEFAFPMAKSRQNQENLENHCNQTLHNSHHGSCLLGSSVNQSAQASSSDVGSSFRKGDASGRRNDHFALVPHKTPDGLGSVLGELEQAKLALQQKINKLPLVVGGSAGKGIEPFVPATKTVDRVEIPVGCAGLFRVPTDFSVEATTQANLLGSGSRLSLPNYYPDTGIALNAGDRIVTNPYMETRSRFPANDRFLTRRYSETLPRVSTQNPFSDPHLDTGLSYRFLTSQYSEILPRVSTHKPHSDPHLDTGLSSSNRYNYPTYPTYPTFPDPMLRMPSNEGFSRSAPSRAGGIPPSDQFSFYDNIRPDMYR